MKWYYINSSHLRAGSKAGRTARLPLSNIRSAPMNDFSNTTTIEHVRVAVFSHGFINSADWSRGLDELTSLSEDEIDAIARGKITPLTMCIKESYNGDYFPFAPIDGVTPEQAVADRA